MEFLAAAGYFFKEHIMKIKLHNISEIHPYESNPRINDSAVDAVATSLKEFGFRQQFKGGGLGLRFVHGFGHDDDCSSCVEVKVCRYGAGPCVR